MTTSTSADLTDLAAPDQLNRHEPRWRREARLAALDWLSANAMPTRRDEYWRYTRVDDLVELVGTKPARRHGRDLDADQLDLLAGDHGGPRLVFVNGILATGSTRLTAGDGVLVEPFSDGATFGEPPSVTGPDRNDGFLALSWLAGDDGTSIHISRQADTAAPVHIIHVSAPDPDATLVTHPNTVIRAEAGATATVIESYVGFAGAALTNASTVIDIEADASLDYHRVQSETGPAAHVGHVRASVGRSARLHATSFSLGAATSRVALDVTAAGDGALIEVEGLYLPAGGDHHDHMVTIDHVASHTTSHQRFKGVIDDRARGSFTGQVIVRPGSVDTSADQANHTLLLTRQAEADSRPWLEILADDVRCTHGATVGRLDDEALFYLRTRGIAETEARQILVDAFAAEVIESVAVDSLREHLLARIRSRHLRPEDER